MVSVEADGSNVAVWTFDKPVVSVDDATGLRCPASGESIGPTISGTYTVDVEYESPVVGGIGATWTCIAAEVLMTFGDGGATLQDGTGFIAGP